MNGKRSLWERGQAMMEYAVLFPMAIGILIIAGSVGFANRMMYTDIVNAFVQPGIEETCEPIDEGPTVANLGDHRVEFCGAVYNGGTDVTTITYCVQNGGDPSISHWVLGVDSDFARSIISTSEQAEYGYDPTTGVTGLKFDTGYESSGNNDEPAPTEVPTEEPAAEPAPSGQEIEPGVYAEDLDVCWFADNNNGGEYVWYMYNPNSAPLIQGQQKKVMFEWYTHRNNGNRTPIQSGQNYDQTGWHRQSTNTQGSYFTLDWYLWDNGFVRDLGTKTIRATEQYRCHFYPNTPNNNTPPQAASLPSSNSVMSTQSIADTAALKNLNMGDHIQNSDMNDDVWDYEATARDILIMVTGQWDADEGTVTIKAGRETYYNTIRLPVQVTDNCEE